MAQAQIGSDTGRTGPHSGRAERAWSGFKPTARAVRSTD